MKLHVIGTGSKGNAYLLENDKEALLIECGVNIKAIKKALDFKLHKLAGCIITHEHGDHAMSVHKLMKYGVDVYATRGTHTAMNTIKNHRAHVLSYAKVKSLNNFRVMAFDVEHDATEPCGFLIKHPECGLTLFLTDTIYAKYTFANLNNVIIEANYMNQIARQKLSDKEFLRNRIIQNHMSLDTCISFLQVNDLQDVNNIVLIHLSDSNSDEELFKRRVQEATGKRVTVADNNMKMDLNQMDF